MISVLRTLYPQSKTASDYDPKIDEEISSHEKSFGDYNAIPPGWREISEAEFVKSHFFSYTPEKTEFRQLMNAGVKAESGGAMINAQLYFFHDGTGVAMMRDFWARKIRFFAFGCDHEYREIHGEELTKLGFRGSFFRTDHAYYCDKCAHKMVTDSSD